MSSKLFENARQFSTGDVNIDNSTSRIINYHISDIAANWKELLELLLRHTTTEATHESVTHLYTPRCHPGTRRTIINDIKEFIALASGPSRPRLAWFSGPAGAGKTCIQRSVAEECLAGTILGGSFFFGRDSGRDSADGLVATLAHQFCSAIPGFREAVLRNIALDISIFSKSLLVQLQHLIFDPLEDIGENQEWIQPKVVIVDGLDECRDTAQRKQVIYVLHALTQRSTFPFCVIVSSRPELDILTTFAEEPLWSNLKKFRLHGYASDDDILFYLVEEFSRIRKTHPAGHFLPANWPGRKLLRMLVGMASGQFIFVSTLINYVGNSKGHPSVLLNNVLMAVINAPMALHNPFADLDALYTQILSVSGINRTLLRLILHAIPEIWRIVETNSLLTESEGPKLGPSPLMLDTFFELLPGTTNIILSQLAGLIHVPNHHQTHGAGYIRFYHKSMEDYLKAPERSGDLFQSEGDTVAQFTIAAIQNLQRWSHTLGSPSRDCAATFGALYLCLRFTWAHIPTQYNLTISELEAATDAKLENILRFDFTILLKWILLFGRRLWSQPYDMLSHMKPQNTPLEGLRIRWLHPIAEGIQILHTCEPIALPAPEDKVSTAM
ncbi:hypothetical protein EST38_g13791 [Candolleomyces aberdarensis]|uniref:Nephrocystin 3-like N-terminal domain-containing protein n=1 Tax=Candolleomyces aberdarensis TaxID=2316362 RepID=A0A4Q2CZ25_9AGAR|nr:hypothetical protein EST38_g13791 [Candolleomyces aberdarensis]